MSTRKPLTSVAGANLDGASDESVAELQDLAERLFLGWVDRKTGEHLYFTHGSREERAAKNAVAYLVRNLGIVHEPPDSWFLNRLADVFDSRRIYALKVEFSFRREGDPGERQKHRRIAKEMLLMIRADKKNRGAVTRAVEAARKKHGFEDSRSVWDIWAQYGKPFTE